LFDAVRDDTQFRGDRPVVRRNEIVFCRAHPPDRCIIEKQKKIRIYRMKLSYVDR
jgi:hypothetical protein